MGVESRDYMQEPSDRGAVSTWLGSLSTTTVLVLVNVVVFLLWQLDALLPLLATHFMCSADGLGHGRLWTLVTCAFSHLDAWHLFWNMVFLYLFGRDLEPIYGTKNLVLLYVVGAVAASLAQAGLSLGWGDPTVPMLGASGSVWAIVVVTTLLFPTRRLSILGILPAPLWLLAGLYLLFDVSGVLRALQGHGPPGGVAHAGHLGGAVAGALFKLLDLRLFAVDPRDAPARPGLLARVRAAASEPPPAPGDAVPLDDQPRVDVATAARVDDLLRKIARDGIQSLTPEERSFLEQASSRYKR